MSLVINRKFLNKEFVPLLFEANKDIVESYREVGPNQYVCCLNAISMFLPPFFVQFSFQSDENSSLKVVDVPTALKGYVQLNLNTTLFRIHPISETEVSIEGELTFKNEFPEFVEKAVAKLVDKILTRLKTFIIAMG